MASVAQPWLFSKFVDPIFALCVGFSAAALRIQREQREKYPEQDSSFPALWQKGVKMNKVYWGSDSAA
ncbi:hypothetical protein Z517_05827 [Fonsecaea pedrosoi CBS 271.37]|uniref:Uncharacterized protein n=1 Tax=Fonsecaea pedrosoi CBS 271.37 TaxID=1442368 RepID=A0A0D2GL06_9EURO|nr:uncharacterized protein Z517_05827 [Fonsecaea pedrosoi CBS 271.37]KIW79215.1 hypothetical protein Z517_05827 [Fonsecaea pedrosoi CBS 271.37]